MLVFPSPSWNILKAVIDNIKESLSSLSDRHWVSQSHCGTARQYLKELSTSKSPKKVNNLAMAVIQPFVMHVVSQPYKALTYFKWVPLVCMELTANMTSWDHSIVTTMTMLTKKCLTSILNPFSWLLIPSSYFMSHS
jgi:hypothetical protein